MTCWGPLKKRTNATRVCISKQQENLITLKDLDQLNEPGKEIKIGINNALREENINIDLGHTVVWEQNLEEEVLVQINNRQ